MRLKILAVLFLVPAVLLFSSSTHAQIKANLLIVGGTEGGWAAAMQAARLGTKKIVLVNDINWLGGQYTAEAVCALDENRGVFKKVPFPRSGLFLELTERFEEHNLKKYGHRQPGNAWTANSTIRPSEAEAIFREILQPYIESGQITLIENAFPVHAQVTGDDRRLTSVTFKTRDSIDEQFYIEPQMTIDASDFGDVIQLCGAAFEYGPDLKKQYNEPSAPLTHKQYPKTDLNPITWCMIIEETDQLETIPQPKHFDDRRYYLTTSVTKKDYGQLNWKHRAHRPFNPPWAADTGKFYSGDRTVYSQRRLLDSYGLDLLNGQKDVLLLNWSVQDYPLDVLPPHVIEELEADELGASQKNLVVMTPEQRQIVFADSKRHSLGMLYHLQTTVDQRMEDKSHSFRRFKLSEEFGTEDNLPPKPYIRESLRLKAMYMMREQDGRNYDKKDKYAPVMYHDGIAVWDFVYDFHPTGRAFVNDQPSAAWEIYIKKDRSWGTFSDRNLFPLRSLIPEKINGLIGAQKNLGYSSIVSSAVRLHDQSVAIGQAAGACASMCVEQKIQPREIPFDRNQLFTLREKICTSLDGGAPLTLWPFRDLSPADECFIAANHMAVGGMLPLEQNEVDFRPDAPASAEWINAVMGKTFEVKWDTTPITMATNNLSRGQFIMRWYKKIQTLKNREFSPRVHPTDFDGDEIADQHDPLPLDKFNRSLPKPQPKPLVPDEDGLPHEPKLAESSFTVELTPQKTRYFNFCGAEVPVVTGFENDNGLKYTSKRGFGWQESISNNHRRRRKMPEIPRDTFLFTREHALWSCDVEPGTYFVTVCVGDSGHIQYGQRVNIQGQTLIDDVTTEEGHFLEKSAELKVQNGKLEIELGKKGGTANTCLNWVRIARVSEEPK